MFDSKEEALKSLVSVKNNITMLKLSETESLYVDTRHHFNEYFDKTNGNYVRSNIVKNCVDTGLDPMMRSFPSLIDIGIMGHCKNAQFCPVDCYQGRHKGDNMSLEDYKSIIDQIKGCTMQVALGGAGSPNEHENFKEIIEYTVANEIIPNYTTSGIGLTDEMVEISKQCGAVAVSWYNQDYTYSAIGEFVAAGIPTSIHFVLSNDSIDQALEWLNEPAHVPSGITAIVFLLYKPVGLGTAKNVLKYDDPKVKRFFELVSEKEYPFKIGFDSCTVPAILNMSPNIDVNSVDSCEGARFSCYITSDMKMLPCSFDNQDMRFAVDLRQMSIADAWYSHEFNKFRSCYTGSCPNCKDRLNCLGGCPIRREIVLCEREEKDLYEV